MSVAAKLKEYLQNNNVEYTILTHPQAFTAQEIAAATHIHGKEMAKSVVVRADDQFVLAVLPAPRLVDLNRLAQILQAKEVRLAHEEEFASLFPGCEVGAMPPFGNLYGLKVYVDESLVKDEMIAFNATTHTEVIRMKYKDFERLVQPVIGSFCLTG